MNYYSIAIFLIIVLPVALKKYQTDKVENILAKVLNLIISFLIFQLNTGYLKYTIYSLINNRSFLKEEVFVQTGILPPSVSGVFYILLIVMSFGLPIYAVLLALRIEKYRKRFLRLLPFAWIIESVNLYSKLIFDNGFEYKFYVIPLLLLYIGFFIFLLYLFYTRKFVKRFFQYNHKEDKN